MSVVEGSPISKAKLAVIGCALFVPLALFALYGGLFLRSMLRNPSMQQLVALLFLWQTQTGAAFALVAALIGAAVILHQTDASTAGAFRQTSAMQRSETERRERRATALRAVLPLALTELADYAANCAEIEMRLLAEMSNSEIIYVAGLMFPPLPIGLVAWMTEMIEVSEPTHGRPLITLVRQVQINHARVRALQTEASESGKGILFRNNLVGRVIDAAEIYARCGKLITYTRGMAEAPAAEITSDDVKQALFIMPVIRRDTAHLEREVDLRSELHKNDGRNWPEP